VPAPDAIAFVRAALPPAPARVLEVGAGECELADVLSRAGYDMLAIDPRGAPAVQVALADLDAPPASFDAAVAMVSLHHVDPLAESVRRLAEVLKPGARLVVDEFDVAALDERAARWWLSHSGHDRDPAEHVEHMREHLHSLAEIQAQLAPWFDVSAAVPCAYLYRWDVDQALRSEEETLIAAGELPATGARLIATRHPATV
jgi:SAM-dependent methyltransferase